MTEKGVHHGPLLEEGLQLGLEASVGFLHVVGTSRQEQQGQIQVDCN